MFNVEELYQLFEQTLTSFGYKSVGFPRTWAADNSYSRKIAYFVMTWAR